MSVYVRADDVRALMNLIGEAREIAAAGECPQAHALQELARIAGADVGVYVAAQHLCTTTPPLVSAYLDHGWSDGERRRVLDFYQVTFGAGDPVLSAVVRGRRRDHHITVRRSDLVTSRAWYASTLHNELHRPVGLDDVIISVRFVECQAQGLTAVILKRAARNTPFSVEERELLHLFRSEINELFAKKSDPAPVLVDALTPREQETLALLLTDASEKTMAARLGISPHTVHTYVTRLYRKIGVRSRAGLMAWSSRGAPKRIGPA
jgi:DNA-binding CsgD family transcriptional regulator